MVFKVFRQTSLTPLISTLLGIIDASGSRANYWTWGILRNHILKILRKASTSSNFANFDLWEYEFKLHFSADVYRVTLYTEKIVHWDLDEGSPPVGSFGDRWAGISRKITCRCKLSNSRLIEFPLRAINIKVYFWNNSKPKTCRLTSWWRNAAGSYAKH